MSNNDVPIWEKYTLTIEEASKYFRIGEKRVIIGYKRVKALSVMERSMTKCQEKNEMKKDGTTKAAF